MRVRLDLDAFYDAQDDPWSIGDADDARYDLYRERLLAHAELRDSILDVGSGFGAFLARFRDDFSRSYAVDVAAAAVERGRERFPWITFERGSADRLSETDADSRRYSAIVYSDVINYLDGEGKLASLDWIARHLEPGGLALVAAYSPGGRYLTGDELRAIVEPRFAIEEDVALDSEHRLFVVRLRRCLVAATIDYETWQPIPEGRTIDWEADVLEPTARLLDVFEASGARLTLFAELGEYLWLREHEPTWSDRMAEQWRDAVARGHDVQLHLHPNWLPELEPRHEDGRWEWDWTVGRAADYPGDLGEAIGRCKAALEAAIRPVDPDYTVTCFRAGAYEAQPFRRLYDALVANGLTCDSSVYAGGRRDDRAYDYRLAYSDGGPYFASRFDPQLKAPPAEQGLVELPILAPASNERWTFDFGEGERFADVLLASLGRGTHRRKPDTERRLQRVRAYVGSAYWMLRRWRPWINRLMPRGLAHGMAHYPPERLVDDHYSVLIGHSKADLQFDAIAAGLARLSADVEWVRLSDMAARARGDLERSVTPDPAAEAERQVRRERATVLGSERNEVAAFRLQDSIPRDRRHILDLGCGAGDWSARIARTMPRAQVLGVDIGAEFVARARELHASDRVGFAVEDFADLSFADGSFDCVYADNSLEHAWDVDRTLREVHRVLEDGGVLVAALPSDARNPRRVCDNHTWKTAPHDVQARLAEAGFTDISVEEVDLFRGLGMPPYPPSRDRMIYVRAWRRDTPCPPELRARQLSRFVYEQLDPTSMHEGGTLDEILAAGRAWCTGYAMAAGLMLRAEGLRVRWVTMVTDEGRPPAGVAEEDAHEVVEVTFPSGSAFVLDAMADVWLPGTIQQLLAEPERAGIERSRDERYAERGYETYASPAWYRRVRWVAVRRELHDVQEYRPASDVARNGHPAGGPAVRRRALRLIERGRAGMRRLAR